MFICYGIVFQKRLNFSNVSTNIPEQMLFLIYYFVWLNTLLLYKMRYTMFRLLTFFGLFIFFSCTKHRQDDHILINEVLSKYRNSETIDFTRINNINERQSIENVINALNYLKQNDSLNKVSTDLLLESISCIEKSNSIGLRVWVYSEVGFYYYRYNHYLEAAPYFIKIAKVLDHNPNLVTVQKSNVLLKTAYFYDTMQKYSKSIELYENMLSILDDNDENKGAVLWALGKCYYELDKIAASKEYFTIAQQYSLNKGDTLRYAKSMGALGLIFKKEGNNELAEQYLKEDVALSKHLREDINQMYAQIQLGKLYFDNGQYKLAQDTWEEANQISKTKNYLLGFQLEISNYLLSLAQIAKDEKSELFYRRVIESIERLIENKESEKIINEINWNSNLERVNWELEAEKSKLDKTRYQRLLFLSTSVLLLLLLFVVYFFSKRIIKLQAFKYEKKLLEFQYAKLTSESNLKQTNATLASYKIYLSEKNEQINTLEKELNKVKNSSNEFLKDKQPDLEQLLNSHLMTDENWNMFKETFKKEQGEYLDYVVSHLPDLTESNLRIILLQKVGLSNLETANILGVTIDAVKKAKQRLKKKYKHDYEVILNQE